MSVEGRRMARASKTEQRAAAERSEPRLGEIGRRGDQTAEDVSPQANKRQDKSLAD